MSLNIGEQLRNRLTTTTSHLPENEQQQIVSFFAVLELQMAKLKKKVHYSKEIAKNNPHLVNGSETQLMAEFQLVRREISRIYSAIPESVATQAAFFNYFLSLINWGLEQDESFAKPIVNTTKGSDYLLHLLSIEDSFQPELAIGWYLVVYLMEKNLKKGELDAILSPSVKDNEPSPSELLFAEIHDSFNQLIADKKLARFDFTEILAYLSQCVVLISNYITTANNKNSSEYIRSIANRFKHGRMRFLTMLGELVNDNESARAAAARYLMTAVKQVAEKHSLTSNYKQAKFKTEFYAQLDQEANLDFAVYHHLVTDIVGAIANDTWDEERRNNLLATLD